MNYAIVEFASTADTAIVPISWLELEEDKCAWPVKMKAHKISMSSLVRNRIQPDAHWGTHGIRVLGKAATYERALKKKKLAEYSSNFNTDINESQTFKKRKLLKKHSDTSSEEGEGSSILFKEIPVPSLPPPIELSPMSHCSSKDVPLSESDDDSSRFEKNSSPRVSSEENPHGRLLPHSATRTPCAHLHCITEESLITNLAADVAAIRENLSTLTSLVETAIGHRSVMYETKLPSDIKFPVSSLQSLEELEKKLEDEALRETLTKVLRDVGGETVSEFVKRAMPFLMRNNVAMRCNMKGRNNKKAFGTSPLHWILFSAVKRNPATAECTQKDLEVAVSRWLVGSLDRDGNRAKRAGKRYYGEAFEEKN